MNDKKPAEAGKTQANRIRKHARLRTLESARLSIGEDTSVECEILDFSETGLQLSGTPNSQVLARLSGSRPPQVEIDFPLNGDKAGAFKLHGELVHTSASGIGLRLTDMTNEAFQALIAARAKLTVNNKSASGLLPEESQSMLRDSLRLFHVFLESTWRRFLDDVAIQIAERNTAVLPMTDHSRYLGALTTVLQRGSEISHAHYVSLVKQMRRIADPRKDADHLEIDESELSIVDDARFEDWLNIAQVFNRIEADHRSNMFEFVQCFSRLTPVPINRHNDPFGPESVCLAYQEAISHLDLDNNMRGLFYKAFGSALASGYGELYEQLNQLLSPLKPAKPKRLAPPDAGPANVQPEVEALSYNLAEPDDQAFDRHAALSHEDISAQVTQLTEIARKLFSVAPEALGEMMAGQSAAARGHGAADTAASFAALAENEPEAFQILRQTLAQLAGRHSRGQDQATAYTAGSAQVDPADLTPISLDELLDQAAQAPSLTHRVSALLNQGQIAHLPSQQRQSLGMTTNLMAQALSEHVLDSDLDDLLKKLEKPLYECLLRSEDPLSQTDHPLRNLFNQIDRFAIVADDRGQFIDKDLGSLLGTVIDHAVEKAESDPNSYANANEALEKLLKHSSRAMKQRLAEHQELCEVQGIVQQAKLKVARMLDSQLGGRSLPRVALTLLDCGLRQYLILQTLRGQEGKCQDTLKLIKPLLDPAESPPMAAYISAIEECLLQVNTDHEQISACVEEIKTVLGNSGGKDNVTLANNWFSNNSELAAQDGADAPSADWPTRLGEWWDFDHEGRSIPMQLIWLDQVAGNFGFANRSATRNVQLNRAKLAKRQATNAIRRGEDRNLPLLDRSANGAVDSLYRQLAHRAHHDSATRLLNRKGLMYAAMRRPNRSGKGHVIGMLEFVPFRTIVDACGMDAGERLTQELIAIVQRRFGPADALATVGDGRLAFMLADMDTGSAHNVVNTLAHAFAGFQFRHEQAQYSVEARIGLASLMPGNTDPTEALRRAATACVAAVNGGDAIQVYEDSGDQLREQESLRVWGRRLDSLLNGDSLFLRCQQIAPLQENPDTRKYYEVLLGVRDEEGNVVSPQPFVEAVEHWKRSRDLDIWVIDHTFDWIRQNQDTFNRTGGFSINLSALSMSDPEILAHLHRQLAPGDIDTSKIIFEITETATVGNYDEARDVIRQIRDYGCRFCIDDFGSGNASYGYLRNLKTDTLKIDGAFVKDMVGDPDLLAMVKSMNDIGHSLGMKTVAEFVANTDILTLVREIGIDYAQGYVIEKPVHIDELTRQ